MDPDTLCRGTSFEATVSERLPTLWREFRLPDESRRAPRICAAALMHGVEWRGWLHAWTVTFETTRFLAIRARAHPESAVCSEMMVLILSDSWRIGVG